MKFKYILLIVLVIIALHLVVVWFFMRGGNVPAAGAEATAGGTEQSIAEAIAATKAKAGLKKTQNLTEKDMAFQDRSKPVLSTTPRIHTPYRYEYAVRGNIPGIPSSANATSGILLDADTRIVLWAKNPERAFPIASMTKLMTLFLAYEDIVAGKVALDTQIQVTRAAAKIGGSQVWLDPRETFSLQDLLMAVSLKSANDAAYLVGEYLGGGDVAAFIARMNRRAAELGMKNTHYYNPHGLPGTSSRTDNVSSPADMATLAEYILEHPLLMKWSSTLYADFRTPGTKGHLRMKNHNNLLPGGRYASPGVDGLKTGFIARSGYCVTVTCLRNGKRMIAMVTGYPTARERDQFLRQLLSWGYSRADDPAAALAETRKQASQVRTTTKTAAKKKTAVKRTATKKTSAKRRQQ